MNESIERERKKLIFSFFPLPNTFFQKDSSEFLLETMHVCVCVKKEENIREGKRGRENRKEGGN